MAEKLQAGEARAAGWRLAVFLGAVVCVIGTLLYANRWHYMTVDGTAFRTNNYTGRAEILRGGGWAELKDRP